MSLPLLALAFDRRPPDAVVPLLSALHEWTLPAAPDAAAGRPAAAIGSVAGLRLVAAGLPTALWAEPEDTGSECFGSARVVISAYDDVVALAGRRGVPAPLGRPVGHRRPVAPFVRARIRGARRLAASYVVEHDALAGWRLASGAPIPVDLFETALACCSAVAVADTALTAVALAYATPCVTSSVAASELRLEPGRDVLVADDPVRRRTLAGDVSRDDALAARLSWHGRAAIERLDADRAAVTVASALGLTGASRGGPPHSAEVELALLGTPRDAHARSRLADALHGLLEETT